MTSDATTEIPFHLLDLAPRELPRNLKERYTGNGFAVSLEEFDAEDVTTLRRIYEQCQGIYTAWLEEQSEPAWPGVESGLGQFRDPGFVARARNLGEPTIAAGASEAVRRVLHDVRGGGLTALIGQADMIEFAPSDQILQESVLLGRDHAKMMRQAMIGIDPEGRRADETERRHTMNGVADKWARREYRLGERSAEIRVDCRFEGGLASRCLEAAAVDRVLYNLMNNATRFTADGLVELHIFPVGNDIRFVVSNAVTGDHVDWLEQNTRGDPGRLFMGGITRGGQGIGLSNCAELVAAAYGQIGPAATVERGHIGARVYRHRYHAWFHWPIYA